MIKSITLQERRAAVELLYHVGVISLAVASGAVGRIFHISVLFDIAAFTALGHALLFRRIPLSRLVQQALVNRHRCQVCGYEIPLASVRLRCICGFVSPPRHCFSRCPRCRRGIDTVNCRCGTGHLI